MFQTFAKSERMPKPFRLRELKAQMVMKELSLSDVIKGTGIPYATASQLLNGRQIDPERLSRLSIRINSAPMPQEAASAV